MPIASFLQWWFCLEIKTRSLSQSLFMTALDTLGRSNFEAFPKFILVRGSHHGPSRKYVYVSNTPLTVHYWYPINDMKRE